MARLESGVRVLTIPSGQTSSNALASGGWMEACTVFAPATLPETVHIELEPTDTGTDWKVLQSGGEDVTVPANRAVTLTEAAFHRLRVTSTENVGADRVFTVNVVVDRF